MSVDYPTDEVLDPVAIVEWSIDTGLFDFAYSAWGWPVAEIVHFAGVCLLFGTVGTFDLRMMGRLKGLSLPGLHRLIPFGVLGFLLCAASGTVFVSSSPDQYLYNPAFQVKMVLIAVAGLNMAAFYLTSGGAVRRAIPYQTFPLHIRLFAAVSFFTWLSVVAAGRVITAFRPPAWFWCSWCS